MSLPNAFSLFSSDLGLDLGTANALVYAKGRGIVLTGDGALLKDP